MLLVFCKIIELPRFVRPGDCDHSEGRVHLAQAGPVSCLIPNTNQEIGPARPEREILFGKSDQIKEPQLSQANCHFRTNN